MCNHTMMLRHEIYLFSNIRDVKYNIFPQLRIKSSSSLLHHIRSHHIYPEVTYT